MAEPEKWDKKRTIRVGEELWGRVEEYRKGRDGGYRWHRFTSSEAVRDLLEKGLEVVEKAAAPKKKKRGRPKKVG